LEQRIRSGELIRFDKKALNVDACTKLKKDIEIDHTRELLLSSVEFDTAQPCLGSSWSRLDAIIKDQPVDNILFRVVEDGINTAFREQSIQGGIIKPSFPGYIIACPYAEFGKIKTVDEKEIDGFSDLGKLIYNEPEKGRNKSARGRNKSAHRYLTV
jgi:hypothetical protein